MCVPGKTRSVILPAFSERSRENAISNSASVLWEVIRPWKSNEDGNVENGRNVVVQWRDGHACHDGRGKWLMVIVGAPSSWNRRRIVKLAGGLTSPGGTTDGGRESERSRISRVEPSRSRRRIESPAWEVEASEGEGRPTETVWGHGLGEATGTLAIIPRREAVSRRGGLDFRFGRTGELASRSSTASCRS